MANGRKINTGVLIIIIAVILVFVLLKIFPFSPWEIHLNTDADHSLRDTSHIILTKHAKCRMDCRHITFREVKEVLIYGVENNSKRRTGSRGDETHAIEGYSSDRQHVRVVVASVKNELVIITCIDLDREWQCDCR